MSLLIQFAVTAATLLAVISQTCSIHLNNEGKKVWKSCHKRTDHSRVGLGCGNVRKQLYSPVFKAVLFLGCDRTNSNQQFAFYRFDFNLMTIKPSRKPQTS